MTSSEGGEAAIISTRSYSKQLDSRNVRMLFIFFEKLLNSCE